MLNVSLIEVICQRLFFESLELNFCKVEALKSEIQELNAEVNIAF
jgi:hypothetical protein